ncbi:UNVERIFIED_CONTAM: hypothetical protein RMT77_008958 [Armadillidium vulgare]
MKLFFVLLCSWLAFGQENVVDIICPIPGNPDPSTVTVDQCTSHTACQYTSGNCHMKESKESGYLVASAPVKSNNGIKLSLKKANGQNTLFGADIEELSVDVIYHQDYHLQIKIYDSSQSRYEVPIERYLPDSPGTNLLYEVTTSSTVGDPFSLEVKRKDTGNSVFKTVGPLTFEDQFIQITTALASTYFYGLGEFAHSSLLRSFDKRITNAIFTRDRSPTIPGSEDNLYGAHPYYINIEDDDGKTHSLFLENSNANEYSTFMLGGSPALTIRTIGGILDFHIFMGPTPDDVTVQYTEYIGRPFIPPYWSLGFHLSKWGYDSTANYMIVHDRMKAAQIPWDVQFFDSDYMDDNRDFTVNAVNFSDFPSVISQLHSENRKIITQNDPGIAIDFDTYATVQRGKEDDVFIKFSDPSHIPADQPASALNYVVGKVWPTNNTVFPDFFKPATGKWWTNEFQTFHKTVDFDGVWIDMNEVSNFETNTGKSFPETGRKALQCPDNKLEKPPYGTLAVYSTSNASPTLSDKTVCMSSVQTDGKVQYTHYNVHSLYAYSQAKATYKGLTETVFPGERPFILTRSSFAGSGKYAVHWLGDNTATWEDLRVSLIGVVEFSFFGFSMIGADICGFYGDAEEELCARWMQTGAFYSFSRNHNNKVQTEQDPAKPGWDTVTRVSRDVLTIRYKYLPFLYSAIYRAHTYGNPAIRSLFSVFPNDIKARSVDDEFFWSDKLLVAPVVKKSATSREVYFPEGKWYDLLNGTVVAQGPITLTVDAPIDKIPLYVRGGSILPFQEPSITTTESRKNPFGLTIALNEKNLAEGELFWDDGHSDKPINEAYLGNLKYDQGSLSLTIQYNKAAVSDLKLTTINIYGYPANPSGITVNGEASAPSSWNFNVTTSVLDVFTSLPLGEEFTIAFN